jgi:serine/threonine protein kinase
MLKKTLVLHREPEAEPKKPVAIDTFQAMATARVDEFAAVRVGHRLDGYEVKENLAEGGMGAVYRVKDRDGARELALKAPLPDGRGGTFTHRLRRFLREVRLTQRMNHPGVAKVVEVGQEDGLPYFTMELVEGTPLSDLMFETPLEIKDACEVIENAARAVHHIHEKGVIHRDLKPQNMLVRKDRSVVIIDFGLSRDAAGIDPRITQEGVWLGTPAYIAPEQAQGDASFVDARADVYSLAAVLYEALTGAPPFGSGNAKQIFKNQKTTTAEPVRVARPECPEAIERVVMRGIAKSRDARFATSLELADALAEARKSLAAVPSLRVETSIGQDLAELDALESALVERMSPTLRAKAKTSSRSEQRSRAESDVAAKRERCMETIADRATWNNLGTSNAGLAPALALAPSSAEKEALPAPAEKRRSTERKIRSVTEPTPISKRLNKRSAADERRHNLLVLAGPALLFIFGLLLLFH